jgi:plasmid stability protein
MVSLTVQLPDDLVERLRQVAVRTGQPLDAVVVDVLVEHLPPTYTHPDVVPAPPGERDRVRAALRVAGLIAELGPEAQRLAAESTATLEEVEAAFARAGGKPLSEIVLEMRGSKE